MMQARTSRIRHTPEETVEAEAKSELAVVPIGIPVAAGPGAIGAVIMIICVHQAAGWFDPAVLALTGLFVALSVPVAPRAADPIGNALGKVGINIVTRLSGLILAAVAIEFITQGLAELPPGLAARM